MVILFLRRPFIDVVDAACGKHLAAAVKALFPAGLFFPALLGFVSVSYVGCDRTSYEKIIQNRNYLGAKNHEQISSTLLAIAIAILAWNVIVLLILKFGHAHKQALPDPNEPHRDTPLTSLEFE